MKKLIFIFFRVTILVILMGVISQYVSYPFLKTEQYVDYYNYFIQQNVPHKFSKPQGEIVLVDIGELKRDSIVSLVEKIEEYNPKVIGLRVFFSKKMENDLDLEQRLSKYNNLIFSTYFKGDTLVYPAIIPKDTIIGLSDYAMLSDNIVYGYYPSVQYKGIEVEHFTTAILKKYDKTLYENLKKRGRVIEQISFAYDFSDLVLLRQEMIFEGLTNLESVFENKIVMLGYFPEFYDNRTDIRLPIYPTNKPIMMNPSVIDANILAMAINNTWINYLDSYIEFLITFLLVLLLDFGLTVFIKQLTFKNYIIYRIIHILLFVGLVFLIFYVNAQNYHTYGTTVLWTFTVYFEYYAFTRIVLEKALNRKKFERVKKGKK